MKTVTVTLTEEEAQELASLLTHKAGMIQWQAVTPVFNGHFVSEERREELDEAWRFWHGISQKVANSFGFEAWMQPSAFAEEETDFQVEQSILDLQAMPPYKIVARV